MTPAEAKKEAKRLIALFSIKETEVANYGGALALGEMKVYGLGSKAAKQCALISQNQKIELLKRYSMNIAISQELEDQESIKSELEKL